MHQVNEIIGQCEICAEFIYDTTQYYYLDYPGFDNLKFKHLSCISEFAYDRLDHLTQEEINDNYILRRLV